MKKSIYFEAVDSDIPVKSGVKNKCFFEPWINFPFFENSVFVTLPWPRAAKYTRVPDKRACTPYFWPRATEVTKQFCGTKNVTEAIKNLTEVTKKVCETKNVTEVAKKGDRSSKKLFADENGA